MNESKKTENVVEGGHEFELDEDGFIEIYGDHHAGAYCMLCHDSQCESCNPDFRKEKCPAKEEATLPGLEYD